MASGVLMAAEMAEQPARLDELARRWDDTGRTVARVRPDPFAGTVIVARGSSDHAGMYGRYLLELVSRRPVSLAAPSLHTLYGARTDHLGFLAVAISQSGRTPEIVATLERVQAGGAAGIAITNDAGSPLAGAATLSLPLDAGLERAVPATKTVTATMAMHALVACGLGSPPFDDGEMRRLPEWVATVLDDPDPADAVAERLAGATRLVTVTRGLLFSAALETALKLKETTRIPAEPFSAADLRHGPIAVIDPGFPVVALHAAGPARADVAGLVADLRERGAEVFEMADTPGAALPLPQGIPEALAPIVAVVRGQQLALALARRRGLDPDAPQGLTKVTAT
jgi:glucosamine--fructose-6-phosphate aminotransferase (isomerizing)